MGKCSKRQVRELKTALRWKIPAVQRQRISMVLLRESGMTQPAIAGAMGVSLSTVNRAHMAYDQGGIKALGPKPCGGRKRENMTIAKEKALLARFAKAAGAGEMLNIHELKLAYGGPLATRPVAVRHPRRTASPLCAGIGFRYTQVSIAVPMSAARFGEQSIARPIKPLLCTFHVIEMTNQFTGQAVDVDAFKTVKLLTAQIENCLIVHYADENALTVE
jgi:transposase